jgi:hypothetical protein
MSDDDKKQFIERAIAEARNGVGSRIDELDRHLRTNYDPKTLTEKYAPQIVVAGAALGLLVGFGMPRLFRKAVAWGVPLAIAGVALKNALERAADEEPAGLS